MGMILVAFFFFFCLTQSAFGQQTQEDTAALAGVVRRQGPWKVVVPCFGVPGTGLTPAPAASADGKTAEALRRGSQSSGDGLTHIGNASPKSGVLQVIFHESRLANITFTGCVWGKRRLQAITGPLIGVQ